MEQAAVDQRCLYTKLSRKCAENIHVATSNRVLA
jgi:hypothetical protein